jgi:hypothetical protein
MVELHSHMETLVSVYAHHATLEPTARHSPTPARTTHAWMVVNVIQTVAVATPAHAQLVTLDQIVKHLIHVWMYSVKMAEPQFLMETHVLVLVLMALLDQIVRQVN